MTSVMHRSYMVLPVLAFALVAGRATELRGQKQAPATSERGIPDVELTDQHGNKVHFYSDLVNGKVVAINTIFTTCTTICPTMGATFQRLSQLLGGVNHAKVTLISISVDPVVDTPERLDQWSHKFGPIGADWILLTGRKDEIDNLLSALQLYTPDKQTHKSVILIGGDGGKDWARASASLPAARLAALIQARLDAASDHSTMRP